MFKFTWIQFSVIEMIKFNYLYQLHISQITFFNGKVDKYKYLICTLNINKQ